MYKLPLGILLCLLLCSKCALNNSTTNRQPGEPLFKIEKDGFFGYINRQGVEIIKPVFRGIGAFTDTLAPARMDGSWGFINSSGNFIIPPVYDYAQSFSEGYALVWKDGEPHFIDRMGNIPWKLPDSIERVFGFCDGKASFSVHKNDQNFEYLLNRNGEIILDTLRDKPWEEDGLFSREKNDKTEWALLDKHGKLIVPFGKYNEIKSFQGNLAEIIIEYPNINNYQIGYIDRSGHLRFMLPIGTHIFNNRWSEGLIATRTNRHPSASGYILDDNYITWYDTLGKVFLTKPDDSDATDFKNGRAFSGSVRNWYLMNKKGEQLGPNRFEWISDHGFSDNMAVVAKHQEGSSTLDINWYGVIDSMGNYLIQPQFNRVHDSLFQKEGMLVAVNEPLKPEHQSPKYEPIKQFWGLIDRKGSWIFPPKFTNVGPQGYNNGLLYAEIDSLYGYIDPKGDFVWKAVRHEILEKPVRPHIDFMTCTPYPAFESRAINDYIKNPNQAQPISKFSGFANHTFGICVKDQEGLSVISGKYLGFKTYVYNSTSDTLHISCQDNLLYIVMQALNPNGVWKDIEYIPGSWCGNSYYTVKLLPNECWLFQTPAYQGEFCTSLRLKFSFKTHYGADKQVIYSNEFPGSVNPGQFWRKITDQPINWKDPFHE